MHCSQAETDQPLSSVMTLLNAWNWLKPIALFQVSSSGVNPLECFVNLGNVISHPSLDLNQITLNHPLETTYLLKESKCKTV